MKLTSLHIGMKVRHPAYGEGVVKSLNEHAAEIRFTDGARTIEPETSGLLPSEPVAAVTGLDLPLDQLIQQSVTATLQRLGVTSAEASIHELGPRWRHGRLVMHPADPTLATKEIELEVFFHKIVMMRNNLRVLEQKINSSETLAATEKADWQQYVTRCYGSMTTFNLLFRDKEGWF